VGWPLLRPGPPRAVGDGQDQALYEWMLAHAAWALSHLRNPLYTDRLNVPDGGNIIANASVLGLGLPMAPVTLLLGPTVAFTVLYLSALAGTAGGWYLVLRRDLVRSRGAAWIGGAVAGFAPGMVAQSLGHLHLIAQFLVPWLVHALLCWLRTGRPRYPVLFGLLVAWQALIAEEVLLLGATAALVLLVGYPLARLQPPLPLRRLAIGAGVAGAVAGGLLAYPLAVQFFGHQHLRGLPYDPAVYSADLAAYPARASVSLGAGDGAVVRLAVNASEQTTFLGWPLLLVAVAVVVLGRRDRRVRLVGAAALVFALLSLGPQLVVNGRHTGWWAPERLLRPLPLFDMLLPTRFGLVVVALLAVLLALGVDRLAGRSDSTRAVPRGRWAAVLRGATLLAVAGALAWVAPAPVPDTPTTPIPAFIADGTWRGYVPAGRTLVPVPLPSFYEMDGMRWAARARLGFALPQGYLTVPDPVTGESVWNAPQRPAAIWFDQTAINCQAHPAVPGEDRILLADLRYWRAAVLVLDPRHACAAQLRSTVEQFLGAPSAVGGVWLWDVRGLSADRVARPGP
jgi:hypothetical protein